MVIVCLDAENCGCGGEDVVCVLQCGSMFLDVVVGGFHVGWLQKLGVDLSKYFYLLRNSRAAASTSLFGPRYLPSRDYLLSSMIMRAQPGRDCIILTDTSATPLDTMKRC